MGAVLTAVSGCDEGAVAAGSGKDDVARFVTDEQRANDPRRARADVDDRDAVGQMVHHPHFGVAARRNRHRLHADRDRAHMNEARNADVEDFELVVRRVDRVEARTVGAERQRPNLAGFEIDEGSLGLGDLRSYGSDGQGQEKWGKTHRVETS